MSRNKDIELIHQITGWSYKESRRRYHENGNELWRTLPSTSEMMNSLFDAMKSAIIAVSKAAEDFEDWCITLKEALSKTDVNVLAEAAKELKQRQLNEAQELGNLQEAECEGYTGEECENCCALPNYMEYQPTKDQDEALDICIKLLNKAIEENEECPCSECKYFKETDEAWKSGMCLRVNCHTFAEETCDNCERKEAQDEDLSDNSIQE